MLTDAQIEALMRATGTEGYPSDVRRLVEAVLALEQPAASGEPVALLYVDEDGEHFGVAHKDTHPHIRDLLPGWFPVYAAPQQAPARAPLTDDQIEFLASQVARDDMIHDFARAVERAHGITPKRASYCNCAGREFDAG